MAFGFVCSVNVYVYFDIPQLESFILTLRVSKYSQHLLNKSWRRSNSEYGEGGLEFSFLGGKYR